MRESEKRAKEELMNYLKENRIVTHDFEIHKLLLEFEYKMYFSLIDHLTLGIIKSQYPIQEILFDYGLKITNIGQKAFSGGWVQNFMISQEMPEQTYLCPTEKIDVPNIKPTQSVRIIFGKMKNHFCGPISISCRIRPNNQNHAIETYQKPPGSNVNEACTNQPSNWFFSSYIEKRSMLLAQNITMLLLLIALLTFFNIHFDLPGFLNKQLNLKNKSITTQSTGLEPAPSADSSQ